MPNARAAVISRGSHMSMYDDQQWYFRKLIGFLKQRGQVCGEAGPDSVAQPAGFKVCGSCRDERTADLTLGGPRYSLLL